MNKHTPGPWMVSDFQAMVIPAAHADRHIGGHEDAAKDMEIYAQEICLVHWPDRHRPESEVRANATIMAAAPDMLEALVDLHAYVTEGLGDHEAGEVLKAKAAIASATGGAL